MGSSCNCSSKKNCSFSKSIASRQKCEIEPTVLMIPNEITANHIKQKVPYQEFFFDKKKDKPKLLDGNAILEQNICKSHNLEKLYYCIEDECKFFGCLECFKNKTIPHELSSITNVLLKRFVFLKFLGKGSFGSVFSIHDPVEQMDFALKLITFAKNENDSDFTHFKDSSENEIFIQKQLYHDNIIKYIESFWVNDNQLAVLLELADSSLSSYISKMNANDSISCFSEIVRAVEYLHNNNIIHRDLKPANILIKIVDGFTKVKVADFGGSKFQYYYETLKKQNTSFGGTPAYLSPEIIREDDGNFTKESDIWALGIIYHKMLTNGRHPFPNPLKDNILKRNMRIDKTLKKESQEIIQSIYIFVFYL